MDIQHAGEKYLKPLVSLIEGDQNQKTFEKYLSGLILENERFSTLEINEKTQEKELSQLYYFLEQTINWRKLLYTQAKAYLQDNNMEDFYLVIDSTPLKQKYAEYRITKNSFVNISVNISEMKNVPNNEIIGLYLTNGEIYNPLEFKFWSSSKVEMKENYKKKPGMLIEFLQYYGMNGIPVKKAVFDNFFASAANLKWLISNEYTFITRLKSNKIVFIDNNRYVLGEIGLNDGESIICQLQGIHENMKILKFWHQNEEYYIVTNDLEMTDDTLKKEYLARWEVEVFHRESKQKLGLEKMLVRSFRRLINRVGLICVVYGFLSGLKQQLNTSIGGVKRKIQNFMYSTQDSADRLACLSFS